MINISINFAVMPWNIDAFIMNLFWKLRYIKTNIKMLNQYTEKIPGGKMWIIKALQIPDFKFNNREFQWNIKDIWD